MNITYISAETYAVERAICDKAAAYAESVMAGKRHYLTAEEKRHPDYVACDHAMRGRVEKYNLLTNPPERFIAYVASPKYDQTDATNCAVCHTRYLITWTGEKLGTVHLGTGWRVQSYIGDRMYQATAYMAGRTYTGRTFGEGMSISLRETAASKRTRHV